MAHDGKTGAAEALIDRYRPLIESKARSYFLLGADREDVIQEGMIGLCKAIRDFDNERTSRFRPFAELCVTRQIISAVKSATRHKHVPLNAAISLNQTLSGGPSEDALIDFIPDSPAACGDQAMAKQLPGNWHDAATQSFSDLERCVLQSFLDGKSYREMSAELNCHTKSIDNALQRVKKKIGRMLVDPCDA